MRRIILIFWILMLLGALTPAEKLDESGNVIRVPEDYPTIQEAINAADPGDTILVPPGTYNESIIIGKQITLIGEGKENTVIVGRGVGDVIYVSSDGVKISGFTIKGSGNRYISPFEGGDAGIKLDGVENCVISNCIVTENNLGIFLNSSDNNIIENNTCYLNRKDGIHLRFSNNNIIRGNNCTSNGGHGGIYLNPSSSNNLIENNICNFNADHGIKLQGSSNNNILRNNICEYNWNAGIFLRGSNNNTLIGNICFGNRNNPGIMLHYHNNNNTLINNVCNSNDEGIVLQNSSNNNILINNTCLDNRARGIGIMWSSNNNTIIKNTLSSNGEGILIESSSYNKVYYNNILMNWRGIQIIGENSTGNEIHQNNIIRNEEWGLLNNAPIKVNATLNWWGSPHGPEVCQFVEDTDTEDPEEIQGNILYEPWLTEPYTMFGRLKIIHPIDRAIVSRIVKISTTVEEPLGVVKVEFYVDDSLVFIDKEASYEYEWNTTAYTDGAHMIKVRAFDALRNMAEKSIGIIVDNTPPSIDIISPSSVPATTNISAVSVEWSAMDGVGISVVRVFVNGELVGEYNRAAGGTTVELVPGENTILVLVVDKAGNNASKEVSVTFTPVSTPSMTATTTSAESPSSTTSSQGYSATSIEEDGGVGVSVTCGPAAFLLLVLIGGTVARIKGRKHE